MKRGYYFLTAANVLSLLLFGIFSFAEHRLESSLPDQRAAERWAAGETPYAQVSVFAEESESWDINAIFTARVNTDKKLSENSIVSEKEGARLWADAFSSGQEKITVTYGRNSAEAELIVTGGDFFLFHPLDMLAGSCYSDDDVMHDRAVIDDVLAWQLYGSSDAAGMPLIIDGKYYRVAGVYKRSDNKNTEKVYGIRPRIFLSYQGYGESAGFTCYEACLPSLVSGQGAAILSEVLSVEDSAGKILVENSDRYSLENRFGIIGNFGMRSVVDSAVRYPYWENAARVTEDKSALLLVFQALFLVLPVLTVLWLLGLLIRNRKKLLRKAWDKIKAAPKKPRGTGKKPPAGPEPEPDPEREKLPITAERN